MNNKMDAHQHPAPERATLDTITPDEIMDRAADLIDENGWCKGYFYDEMTGAMCVSGALMRAGSALSALYTDSAECVAVFIENHLDMFITTWNDQYCQDQGAATELLRTEAKRYREEML
jgi:hypothetical protein